MIPFVGIQTYAYLHGSGFFNYAEGFDRIEAHSTRGGGDRFHFTAVDYVLEMIGDWVPLPGYDNED